MSEDIRMNITNVTEIEGNTNPCLPLFSKGAENESLKYYPSNGENKRVNEPLIISHNIRSEYTMFMLQP